LWGCSIWSTGFLRAKEEGEEGVFLLRANGFLRADCSLKRESSADRGRRSQAKGKEGDELGPVEGIKPREGKRSAGARGVSVLEICSRSLFLSVDGEVEQVRSGHAEG